MIKKWTRRCLLFAWCAEWVSRSHTLSWGRLACTCFSLCSVCRCTSRTCRSKVSHSAPGSTMAMLLLDVVRGGWGGGGGGGGGVLWFATTPTPPSLIGHGPFIFTSFFLNPNCYAYDYTKWNVLLAVAVSSWGGGGGVIKEGKVTKDNNKSLFLIYLFFKEFLWVTWWYVCLLHANCGVLA